MAQFKFIIWLAYWYQQTESFEFQWDRGNSSKSDKKHAITIEEIETLFEARLAVPIGHQVSPKVTEERLCIVGPATSGKMLSVVFTLRDGKVRPISGRPASKKERLMYEEISKALKNL